MFTRVSRLPPLKRLHTCPAHCRIHFSSYILVYLPPFPFPFFPPLRPAPPLPPLLPRCLSQGLRPRCSTTTTTRTSCARSGEPRRWCYSLRKIWKTFTTSAGERESSSTSIPGSGKGKENIEKITCFLYRTLYDIKLFEPSLVFYAQFYTILENKFRNYIVPPRPPTRGKKDNLPPPPLSWNRMKIFRFIEESQGPIYS